MNDKNALSRRTVVKGAAWTVPAVAVATMAPMAAATNDGPTPGGNDNWTCTNKYRGPGNYNFSHITIEGVWVYVHTLKSPDDGNGNPIDVTIRQAKDDGSGNLQQPGNPDRNGEFHRYLRTTPANPNTDHEVQYTPGEVVRLGPLARPFKTQQGGLLICGVHEPCASLARDFIQVSDVHEKDCVPM